MRVSIAISFEKKLRKRDMEALDEIYIFENSSNIFELFAILFSN